MSEPGTILVRGTAVGTVLPDSGFAAWGSCHVPQTADVDGELRDRPGAGADLRLCLLLVSRRQEACMMRRGQVASEAPACGNRKRGVLSLCPTFHLYPSFPPASLGPGREVGSWVGQTRLGKTARLGVWLFRGALQGERVFSALSAAGDWEKRGSYHKAQLSGR